MFNNSFVCDGEYSHEDIQSMVETWINIEYDVDVIDTIVPEKIDDIEETSMNDGIIIVDVEYDSKDYMEEILVNGQKHTNF